MSDIEHRSSELEGGLRVATAQLPHVATVAVGIWFDVGTRDERPEEAGAAHLLEHMAFKGTGRRDARRIAEEIESVGGSLDAHTSRDHTAYYARLLAEDMPVAVDILADIVQHATLDADELARERQVVLQEIAEVCDTPDDLVFDLFQEAAFPDQPLGWPILGRRETVAGIERERLLAFLRDHYVRGRAVVAAAGRVEHEPFLELVRERFADLAEMPGEEGPAARYVGGERRVERDLDQVHIVLGGPAPGRQHRDFFACHLLSNILGGGMSSRLFQEVREKRGLAYSVFSFYQPFREIGLVGVYSATEPERAAELAGVLCDEVRRMAEDGCSAEELARAKRQLEASLLMSLESCSAVCEDMARQILFFGRRIPVAELIARIRAIEASEIVQVARHILTQGPPTLAAVGPVAALPEYDRLRTRLSGGGERAAQAERGTASSGRNHNSKDSPGAGSGGEPPRW